MYMGLSLGPSFLVGMVMLWPKTAATVLKLVLMLWLLGYLWWPKTIAVAAVVANVIVSTVS